jgi:hypothetical protein
VGELGGRLRGDTMIPSLLPWFEAVEATSLGQLVRESVWLFPVIEAVHLLGLCVLGAAVLLVDLRLLGVGVYTQPVAVLARGARTLLLAGIALMIATGVPLFMSEAVKCFYNPSFWVKMIALPIAIAFTLGVRQRLAEREPALQADGRRVLGCVSLLLWFTVAAAGRWIGFSS